MGLANSETRIDNSKPRPASFIPSQGPAIGLPSPLGSVMSGQRSGGRSKKDMNTPLLLTALVDAFSILVIFLLVQVSNTPNVYEQNDKIVLPTASSIEVGAADTETRVASLVVNNGGYILDGQEISMRDLKAQLKQMKTETGSPVRLIIQADQKSNFDMMTPLLALTAEAGVSKLEFAVETVESKK